MGWRVESRSDLQNPKGGSPFHEPLPVVWWCTGHFSRGPTWQWEARNDRTGPKAAKAAPRDELKRNGNGQKVSSATRPRCRPCAADARARLSIPFRTSQVTRTNRCTWATYQGQGWVKTRWDLLALTRGDHVQWTRLSLVSGSKIRV
jgi:hypothetical protein